jgi:FO synthase
MTDAFRACGLPDADAATVAGAMLDADLSGSDAHGVFRLPGYVRNLQRGNVNPRANLRVLERSPATALLDGDNGMGHLVMQRAADTAIALAKENGVSWVGAFRSALHVEVDTTGRTSDRRGDFDSVYGDWQSVRADARAVAVPQAPALRTGDVSRAMHLASDNPAALLEERNEPLAMSLFEADGADLSAVCDLADDVRAAVVGDEVTYVVNRNVNFSNVCYVGCRFCAFAQRRTDPDAYSLSLDEVAARVREAVALGPTEICMQGGIDPDLPATGYADLARAVKAAEPGVHLHAFSPMEVMNGVARTGLSVTEFLTELRAAGVDTIPGTAAEILDDDVRWVLTKGKLPAAAWVDVVTTAHRVGLRSSSTMMYGHVDHPRHWLAHLRVLARIQDQTGGFTEFVPLPFVHTNAPVYLAGIARPGPTVRENRVVHAMARLLLHGRVDHVQTSWVKLGPVGTEVMLRGGADDLGGTLMEETISRMAGSQHGSAMTVQQLHEIARSAGRTARERTTTYGVPPVDEGVDEAVDEHVDGSVESACNRS